MIRLFGENEVRSGGRWRHSPLVLWEFVVLGVGEFGDGLGWRRPCEAAAGREVPREDLSDRTHNTDWLWPVTSLYSLNFPQQWNSQL